jgi:hypothetical protein
MTYTDQIEAYVAVYPETTLAYVPRHLGVDTLPAYPAVEVRLWDEPWCELIDVAGDLLARFRVVG